MRRPDRSGRPLQEHDMSTGKPMRLFFALPCPAQLAEAIGCWRDSVGIEGRPVAQANLHLTLAFLGNQPQDALESLKQLAAELSIDAFALQLDRLQMIGKDYACLVPGRRPSQLDQLVAQLHAGLAARGVALGARPFLPHVTLSRHVRALPDALPPPLDWPVDRFGLYQSENTPRGVRYRELASWALGANR